MFPIFIKAHKLPDKLLVFNQKHRTLSLDYNYDTRFDQEATHGLLIQEVLEKSSS